MESNNHRNIKTYVTNLEREQVNYFLILRDSDLIYFVIVRVKIRSQKSEVLQYGHKYEKHP